MTQKVIFLRRGIDTSPWIAPGDINTTLDKVELLGPGGNGLGCGAGGAPLGEAGQGGSGGCYALKNNLAAAPGQHFDWVIGAGGSQQDTWFKNIATVLAKAGLNGVLSDSSNPAPSGSIGDVTYQGGAGGGGDLEEGNSPGFGGGAAGLNGAGADAGVSQGGQGDNTHGGLGGAYGNDGVAGTEWTQTSDSTIAGSGGGSGIWISAAGPTHAGKYGAGSGATFGSSTTVPAGGASDGLIVITYTPIATTAVHRDWSIPADCMLIVSRGMYTPLAEGSFVPTGVVDRSFSVALVMKAGVGFPQPIPVQSILPFGLLDPDSAPRSDHVRRGQEEYAQDLADLLPTGPAWTRDPDTVLMQLIFGLGGIWGQIDNRAADLLERESDPRATIELLPDWERNFGLPDLCIGVPQTIADRQAALVARMTLLGGQSRSFFYSVAQMINQDIRIVERAPFMCGISQCGDVRDDAGSYRWELGPPEIRFNWSITKNLPSLAWRRCGSGQCGVDPMLRIGFLTDFDCLFDRWKPAHTLITFDYSEIRNWTQFTGTP